jgi:tRNA (guanine37-N1)-methyltransferase
MKVPDVLLGGNHAEIEKWRRRKSLEKTARSRPDLIRARSSSNDERRQFEIIFEEIDNTRENE